MSAPDPFPPTLAAEIAAMEPAHAELAVAVRAARPLPQAERARRLDARVARALADPSAGRSRRDLLHALLTPALALAACALLALVAVLGAGDESGGGGGGAMGGGAGTGGAGMEGGGAGTLTPASPTGPAPSSAGARAVERTTTLRLATPRRRIDAAAAGAARVAATLGGYVASSTVTSGGAATLQLAVPGERLDQAVARLSRLGRVRELERSTLDITGETGSARSRVADLRAERRSLLTRLERATSARAATRLRGELARVTRRLERARAAVRDLRGRAAYATIALTIEGRAGAGAGAGGGRWTPGDALRDAGRVLEVAAGVAIVGLALLVPLGVLGALAAVAARRVSRRRLERGLDAL